MRSINFYYDLEVVAIECYDEFRNFGNSAK